MNEGRRHKEHWEWIDWSECRYLVSDEGKVMVMPREAKNGAHMSAREVSWYEDPLGYRYVRLCVPCGNRMKFKHFSVHRLVAAAFCRKRKGCNDVNHKNGIKNDNRACNLEWCSRSENIQHRYDVLGKRARGVLSMDQAREIRRAIREDGATNRELAEQYGVSLSCISQIRNNHTYKESPTPRWQEVGESPDGL